MAKNTSVKSTQKTALKNTNKDRQPKLSAIGFWLPMIVAVVNTFLLVLGVGIYATGIDNVTNRAFAEWILKAFQIALVFCPSELFIMLFMYRRHSAKYAKTPGWFRKMPGILSIMVLLLEIAYLCTLMIG